MKIAKMCIKAISICLILFLEIIAGQERLIGTFEGLGFDVVSVQSLQAVGYDGIIYITDSHDELAYDPEVTPVLNSAARIDKAWNQLGVFPINLPAQRLVYSPVGSNHADVDDIQEVSDAARSGMQRALSAGVKKPILVVKESRRFPNSLLVGILGALEALYMSPQLREAKPNRKARLEKMGVWSNEPNADNVIRLALKLESGRVVARDIGGQDSERMTPIRVEEYVRDAFKESSEIGIDVISSEKELSKEYPLFAAVNRAANTVERHKGRIIYLTYTAPEPQRTLYLVGKGITFDVGGVHIKTSGMESMSLDKSGAAAVAGFMKIVSLLRPENVSVVGIMSMTRNSIGADAYLPDEILTARSGKTVRVSNTDAEGRFVMADPLYHAKEMAMNAVNPMIMTIATLTGAASHAVGPYPIVLDNGPARLMNNAIELQKAGDEIGDILEIGRIRREDYLGHLGGTVDLLQSSSFGSRGYQGPAAFLIMASGLDEHGLDSPSPIPYCHIDIAGSISQFPHLQTAAPTLALAQRFLNLDNFK